MISIGSLQRSIAVYAVLVGLIAADWAMATYGPRVLPGFGGRLAAAVATVFWLAAAAVLTSWERRRRREDAVAVRRVLEAARSVGVELEEDRAIFPVFYRGRRPVKG